VANCTPVCEFQLKSRRKMELIHVCAARETAPGIRWNRELIDCGFARDRNRLSGLKQANEGDSTSAEQGRSQ